MLLSHSEHHAGCPLQSAQMVLCSKAALEHLSLWQSMFASTLSILVLLLGVIFIRFRVEPLSLATASVRFRTYHNSPRPTFLQELFSSGILNRKEDHHF
jgi:hypothetical protein